LPFATATSLSEQAQEARRLLQRHPPLYFSFVRSNRTLENSMGNEISQEANNAGWSSGSAACGNTISTQHTEATSKHGLEATLGLALRWDNRLRIEQRLIASNLPTLPVSLLRASATAVKKLEIESEFCGMWS